MLDGEPVHIYYYIAVILYMIEKSDNPEETINDFFDSQKQVFKSALKKRFINEFNPNH